MTYTGSMPSERATASSSRTASRMRCSGVRESSHSSTPTASTAIHTCAGPAPCSPDMPCTPPRNGVASMAFFTQNEMPMVTRMR